MNRHTLISMIITIILFIASIALIAFGIDMSTNPVSYHYGHGLFSYSIRYISTESIHTGAVLFSLGRALLISSFVMLGFTLYFSFSKKNSEEEKMRREKKRKLKQNDRKTSEVFHRIFQNMFGPYLPGMVLF